MLFLATYYHTHYSLQPFPPTISLCLILLQRFGCWATSNKQCICSIKWFDPSVLLRVILATIYALDEVLETRGICCIEVSLYALDEVLGTKSICCIEVSLYVLQVSRRELMGLDFEGILNFFRVTLPRKFQSEEECKSLFQTMSAFKVSFIILNLNFNS